MSSDEETFVIIVGDDEFEIPDSVKDVVENSEITNLIVKDETEIDNFEVTEELGDDNFIMEEVINDNDEEYIPKAEETSSDDDISDDDVNKSKRRKPKVITSYVQELRDEYPELHTDNKIIDILAQIMEAMKPPQLPQDYFIMNGIMSECVKCGKLSNGIPAAARHYQEYHGERYLICFACGVDFRSATNLYKHEKRCTAPDIDIVLRARARHVGSKRRSASHLDHNSKEHSDQWTCGQCPARYATRGGLEAHERLHAGQRPHLCTSCPAAYTSQSALLRHTQKHNGEQFVCDHCGHTYTTKTALESHLDTHLPLKKYACSECDKRYAQKFALKLHVDREHLNLPPPCACQLCPRRYPRMSLLKQHMKKAHGLLLMTRKMFYKMMPTLSEYQVEQAKVVLQSEVEPSAHAGDPSTLHFDTGYVLKAEPDYFLLQN